MRIPVNRKPEPPDVLDCIPLAAFAATLVLLVYVPTAWPLWGLTAVFAVLVALGAGE